MRFLLIGFLRAIMLKVQIKAELWPFSYFVTSSRTYLVFERVVSHMGRPEEKQITREKKVQSPVRTGCIALTQKVWTAITLRQV